MRKENGITLIALIITIIIMLILVGVTINFALNGGIINKAKEATIQTEIAMIQEQLMLKKAEIIADNMGNVPSTGYGLSSISDLDGLSESTITKYNSKLTISPDGTLYYLEDKVTGEEKVYFENAKITAYQEQTIDVNPDVNPEEAELSTLAGKTFKCPIMYSPTMISAYEANNIDISNFDLVFSENTVQMQGTTMSYTYDDSTRELTLTVPEDNSYSATIQEVKENDETINYYFILGSSIYTLNGSIGLRPFTGEFIDSSNNTISFSTEGNYGVYGYNQNGIVQYYCFVEDPTTPNSGTLYNLHGGDCGGDTCSYTKDEQGNYTSITINGTEYLPNV